MKVGNRFYPHVLAAFLLMLLALPAHALAIRFVATDVTDVTAGEDLWRYEYRVQGALDAFSGFTLLYPETLYGPLGPVDISPDAMSWFLTPTSPDPGLGTDGLVSAQALEAIGAAELNVLLVDVVWKGQGAPGAQDFEVFNESFQVVDEGRTQPAQSMPVPEPGTLVLAATGIALLMRRARRRI